MTIGLNPSQLSSDTSTTSGLSLVGIDSGNSVRAVINALASKPKEKLLASPHIMVSDNWEAKIQVGQQVKAATASIKIIILIISFLFFISFSPLSLIIEYFNVYFSGRLVAVLPAMLIDP